MRSGWERKNPNSPWEQVKNTVRETWETVTGENTSRGRSY